MRVSRATIFADVPGHDEVLLVQPWTRQVALLPSDHATQLRQTAVPDLRGLPDEVIETLRSASFLVASPEEDDTLFTQAYSDYLGELDQTPTQLVVVPTLGCNLACTYCYQAPFEAEGTGLIDESTLEALFRYVDRFHAHEVPKPYFTLFGGEPLIDRSHNRARIQALLDGARARNLEVAVVTNGYDLGAFVDLLARGPIREVQVTLDGPEAVHDARRRHVTGAGTFQRVVAGIEAALASSLPLNLRVVVDQDNLESLVELARLARDKGWLGLGEHRFKTQVGRNYELFGCAAGQQRERLLDRLELWTRFAALAHDFPELGHFYRPRFHGIRHLSETGEFPPPNFDACPATKQEWAFGPDGYLYGCTATVGHPEFRLGTYAPEIHRDEAAISRFRDRNVFTIPACTRCDLAPVCGGGCGALAWRAHGETLAPDCRPARELLALGVTYYRLGEHG
jgi:uncharacterized protein